VDIQLYQRSPEQEPRTDDHEYHPEQQRYYNSEARFNAVCAGRRSGKSVLARARLVRRALNAHVTHRHVADYTAVICAPTRDQVKRLHWNKLKLLLPAGLRPDTSEGELRVQLVNGATIRCLGMDKPERAEGEAIDDALLDEIADMKEEAWIQSVRPSLGTRNRPGRCEFVGKPRGRNHWWRIWTEAAEKAGWDQFHWNSEEILPREEIESFKQDLDPISYDQEVRANFVNFSGRAYYAYFEEVHQAHRLFYQPSKPLDLTFDFNVEPGTAGISQEQHWETKEIFDRVWLAGEWVQPYIQGRFTALLDEVWIGQNSNTLAVCREIAKKWGPRHKGLVRLYGDATGSARKTSATQGSDWDIIVRELSKVPGWRIRKEVPSANPYERDRVNAVNTRLMTSDGRVRIMLDAEKCPKHALDFAAVTCKPDGSGEIDKKIDTSLTHPSDGFGYKVWRIAPIRSGRKRGHQV